MGGHKKLVEVCNPQLEFDLIKTNWIPICVNGSQWYVSEQSVIDNSNGSETSVKIYKNGANGIITTTLPAGTINEGNCIVQRSHYNYVITGTTPLVIPSGAISISITKTNGIGVVNISGDNATLYPLTTDNENFSDGVLESVSTLSAYTITGSLAGTTYKVHLIR